MEDISDVNRNNFTEAVGAKLELLWTEDRLEVEELRTKDRRNIFRDKHMIAAKVKIMENKR